MENNKTDNDIIAILEQSEEERINSLTDEQKKIVRDTWDSKNSPGKPPSLKELVTAAWNNPEMDTRSWQGRLVREYLVELDLKPTINRHVPRNDKPKELTEAQKEYVKNNMKNMSVLEMTRELFDNKKISPLHAETRLVIDMVNQYHRQARNPDDEEVLECKEYVPPKTQLQAVARINRYILDPLDSDKLTSLQKKCVHALMGYLHTRRFIVQINTFVSIEDKVLFESEFVRCTYDKEDLSAEEVDQYIVYATEVIIGNQILWRVQKLEEEQDRQLEEADGRINMALVDAVKSLRDEYNKCAKRQNDLLDHLKGKRRERINTAIKESASILNLVALWKEEDSRKQLITLALKEREGLKEEIDRLSSMDELKAKILGLSEEDILFG